MSIYRDKRANNYSDVKRYLSQCQAFTHRSCSGRWDETRTVFSVFSYRTCVAWVNTYGECYISPEYYSVTTSKQQGYIRAYLPNTAPIEG